MIELKELRIGNWILPNDAEYWIKEFNLKQLRFEEEYISNLKRFDPIELTPKLLENFGFKKCILDNMGTDGYKISVKNYSISLRIRNNEEICCHFPNIELELKYLHQLQNLFYALTGIELNDIVAYNYYKSKFQLGFSFNEFMQHIGDKRGENYSIGDLPSNLFL